jgi:MoxR-like ATPase
VGVANTAVDEIVVVCSEGQLSQARSQIDATTITDEVRDYAVAVVRATRDLPSVELGASPRASVHLIAASRAKAVVNGRDYVTPDDVVEMASVVLTHRLVLSPEAELERYSAAEAVTAALNSVAVPR